MKKSFEFNPFYFQKFVGQIMCKPDMKPSGKREILINTLFSFLLLISHMIQLVTVADKCGDGNTFISYLKYWGQTLCVPLVAIYFSFGSTMNATSVLEAYHLLQETLAGLRKLAIPIELKFKELYFLYLLHFSTLIIVLIVDLTQNGSRYNFFYWLCQYVPTLAVNLYLICIFYFWISCTQIFVSLNEFLGKSCCFDLSPLEKLAINKKNMTPEMLLEKFKAQNLIYLEKMFQLHDATCSIVRNLQNATLFEFMLFFYFVVTSLLSLAYDFCMDGMKIIHGIPLGKTNYAVIYCPVISFVMFLVVIRLATRTMNSANSTKIYLHKLANLYPKLGPYIEMYSLQLLHQDLKMDTFEFFTYNRQVLFQLTKTTLTFTILFAQLETIRS